MTINQRAVADPDKFTVRRTIRIAAPPEKVWAAITEPEYISRWFGRTVLSGDGVGAHGSITWPDGVTIPIRVEATQPLRSITYRWCNDDIDSQPKTVDDAPSTVFTFTLEPASDGTVLMVEETGFELVSDPAGSLESHRQGWDDELDKLVRLLEGGSL